MADHHKGYAVPIGGVVAYKDAISPSGVGFDIACGNKAVLLLNTTPLRMIQFDPGRARTRRWVRCGLNATKSTSRFYTGRFIETLNLTDSQLPVMPKSGNHLVLRPRSEMSYCDDL